jgi:hypothetical protein
LRASDKALTSSSHNLKARASLKPTSSLKAIGLPGIQISKSSHLLKT